MRRFTDDAGVVWEAVLGKESYGTIVLLFSGPAGVPVRKVVLRAESAMEGEQEVEQFADDDLRGLLEKAVPWDG